MVTDTAPDRYPDYPDRHDTLDDIDFERMTRVVLGLHSVVRALTGTRPA